MYNVISLIDHHNRKTKYIKYICIILSIISILFLSFRPIKNSIINRLSKNISIINNLNNDSIITQAKFYSVSDDRNFYISAKKVSQKNLEEFTLSDINANISSKDNKNISLISNKATWTSKDKNLILNDKVILNFQDEYILESSNINLNLNDDVIVSNNRSILKGILGILDSNGFILKRSENQINFVGPIKLIINKL